MSSSDRSRCASCTRAVVGVVSNPGVHRVKLNVNGQTVEVDAEPSTPLLWVLREHVGLTGTKFGCGVAQCGACTVHLDGVAVRSCVLPVAAVGADQKVVTIEGLSKDSSHPVQKAWMDLDVPQCGYCQSGQIMAVAALLKEKPQPTDDEINEVIKAVRGKPLHQLIAEGQARLGSAAPATAAKPAEKKEAPKK